MPLKLLGLLTLLVWSLLARAAPAPTSAPMGLQRDVVFTEYSPYSRSTELMRRTLSPLAVQRVEQSPESAQLRDQAIDLAKEKFAIYVPPDMPAGGYALLVYVPPWEEAGVPKSWMHVFDQHGMIFVTAANSGNVAKILDRREPLALLAAHNVMQRYRVDPQRVYIGGFSGGSRVALRIALGYPDLFQGALLNAGSDTLGDATRPLPPADLFRRFQESMRLVYLTNKQDYLHVSMDLASRHSMQEWCVSDIHAENTPWAGHDAPDAITWSHALGTLDGRDRADEVKLAQCRSRIDQDMNQQLQKIDDLVSGGRKDEAQKLLYEVDGRYGGLAAPRSTDLQTKIDALH